MRCISFFLFAGLGVVATAPGCNCTSTSGQPTTDSGIGPNPDVGPDVATTEAAADSGACDKHLTAGFSVALASVTPDQVLTGNATGRTLAMALDENDDPMFAYVDSPSGAPNFLVEFTRWDPCAGAFTEPVQVDTNHAGYDVSIAYDPSTKEVGIAYAKAATDNGWVDTYGEVWLASMRAPATSFSLQLLNRTHTCCHGNGALADWSTATPSIAMQGGALHIAYVTSSGDGGDDEGLVWFLSSASKYEVPPASADGTGAYDAGAEYPGPMLPAHDFAYTAVPFTGTPPNDSVTVGYAYPVTASQSVSVALDSTGAPALAVYEANGAGYPNYRTLFWRPGMASAIVANEFNVDNAIDLSLAFHGTSPVIAGHMLASATSDSLTVVSSADGTTWSAPVQLPNGGTSFTSALAFDGAGHAAIASDENGSNPTCAGNPYVALSADDGATWTTSCPGTQAESFTTHSVNASYGHGRLAGKLTVGFLNGTEDPDAGAQAGITVWQSP